MSLILTWIRLFSDNNVLAVINKSVASRSFEARRDGWLAAFGNNIVSASIARDFNHFAINNGNAVFVARNINGFGVSGVDSVAVAFYFCNILTTAAVKV